MATFYYDINGHLWKFCIDASFFDSIISIAAIVVSIVAVIVSLRIAAKQNKISLLYKRIEILESIEYFIYKDLESWEWDGEMREISRFSTGQIQCLFDKAFCNYYKDLLDDCKKANELFGDFAHAQRRGDCNGRTADQIEAEKEQLFREIEKKFDAEKDRVYKKWINI